MKRLEFFFDFSSPYSYLASTQLPALAQRTGAELVWRPFLLAAVLKATGTGLSEAMTNMQKAKQLFKDLQDWAKHYGLPPVVLPATFPILSLQANRVGLAVQEQGKLPAFAVAVYRTAFVEGGDLSDPNVLATLVREVGADPEAAFARAQAQELKDRLRQNTDEAIERGAFGAPTFFVGEEMFFGNDRLHFVEAALRG